MRERASSVRDGWCPDSESPRRSGREGGMWGGGAAKTTAAPHRAGGGCVATGGF